MHQQCPVDSQIYTSWQRFRSYSARVPAKAWLVLALFLIAAVAMAVHTAVFTRDASLYLRLQHGFRSAQLSISIDGDPAYSAHLSGTTKKRFGLIPDSVQGNLTQLIPLAAGTHVIHISVQPDDSAPVQADTSAEFTAHCQRELSVSVRRSSMSLNWQVTSATEREALTGNGWLGRYAGSLFMTIAGSIISALTGYAIRELPAHLRNRQTAEPKP